MISKQIRQLSVAILLIATLLGLFRLGLAVAASPVGQEGHSTLIPHSNDGLTYGYVDLAGDWVIEPQFESAGVFVEGLAVVSVGGQYGYIDGSGRMVIEPQFGFANPFSEGLALVDASHTPFDASELAYIDPEGNIVIDASQYTVSLNFSEGLAAFLMDGKYGFIDKTGQEVIAPQFDFAGNFSEGLAAVSEGGKYGYIDQTGSLVIAPTFDFGNDFSEGLAAVTVGNRVGYIDPTGEIVIEPDLLVGFQFSEGMAYVETEDKVGYIDKMGQMIIEGSFSSGDLFSEGLAAVSVEGQYGYIDTVGQMIIEPQYAFAQAFENGVARVTWEDSFGYIDQTGQVLITLSLPQFFISQATNVVNYLPLIPSEVREGSCFVNSLVTPITSAWRCTVDNAIFDPCLVGADGQTLVCGDDPVTGEAGFQLDLTEPLPEPEIAATPTSEADGPGLSLEALLNAEYTLDFVPDGPVKLSDGRYEEPIPGSDSLMISLRMLTDTVAYGDLNGDGLEDAAVILAGNTGGSGVFYDLAAVLNRGGQPDHVAATLLGDRVVIQRLAIDDGRIRVEMITQGPNDPMCCPTTPVTIPFILADDNTLAAAGVQAWLIQLAGGTVCNFATGATAVIEDKRMNYLCSDSSSILGELDPGVTWTAQQVTVDSSDSGFVISTSQTVDISTVWQPVDPARVVQEIGLSPDNVVLEPGNVLTSVKGQIRPAVPYNPNVPPAFNGEPAHLRFASGDHSLPAWAGVDLQVPQLLVYPVEAYRAMYRAVGMEEIENRLGKLQDLLTERPETVAGDIPVLPSIGSTQVFKAQVDYLEFQNGAGVRFVTHYAVDAGPVINGSVFYTFQGLTSDGRYYVAFYAPVSASILADTFEETEAAENYDAFLQNFETYLQETREALDTLESAEYTPDLAELDAVIESLQVGR